jgi:hypothetical protein
MKYLRMIIANIASPKRRAPTPCHSEERGGEESAAS